MRLLHADDDVKLTVQSQDHTVNLNEVLFYF